jgi:predicted peroxiredoxin
VLAYELATLRSRSTGRLCDQPHPDPDNEELADCKCPRPWIGASKDLYAEFIDNGGQVWLCGACTKPRGIAEDHVVKGATIVGAAKVVEEMVAGAKAVAFA